MKDPIGIGKDFDTVINFEYRIFLIDYSTPTGVSKRSIAYRYLSAIRYVYLAHTSKIILFYLFHGTYVIDT